MTWWPAAYRKVMFFSHGFKRGLWSLQPKDGGMKRVLFWMRGSVEWNVRRKKKCVCEHSTYLSHKPGTGCNSIEVSLSPLNACEMQPLTTFLTSKAVKSDTVLTSTTLFLTDFSQVLIKWCHCHWGHLKKRENVCTAACCGGIPCVQRIELPEAVGRRRVLWVAASPSSDVV